MSKHFKENHKKVHKEIHKQKHKNIKKEILFYGLIAAILLFVAGSTFLLMPLFLLAKPTYSYIILLIFGLSLGFFLKSFLHDLEVLLHHHLILWLVLLISVLLNLTTKLLIFHRLGEVNTNPYLLTVIFTAGFIIPFLKQKNNKNYKHKKIQ